MRRLLYTALAACAVLLGTPFAQGESPVDETKVTLRHEMLRLINRDRAAHGLAPVELDAHASTIADQYCAEQIRTGITGHFGIDGNSPYMRYSYAGGNDGVSENAAAWSASYTFTDRNLYEMLRKSQEAMMAERPPHDGHRRAILDPHATHVGIGLSWEKGEFRIAQEFLRRYLVWQRLLPRSADLGQEIVATARPLAGYKVEAISVHHEPIPQAISPITASLIDTYSLPDKRRDYLPKLKPAYRRRRVDGALEEVSQTYADGRTGDFKVAKDGSFTFNVPLPDGPGVYTVVVWVKKDGYADPIAASNVSIRVEAPGGGVVTAAASGQR